MIVAEKGNAGDPTTDGLVQQTHTHIRKTHSAFTHTTGLGSIGNAGVSVEFWCHGLCNNPATTCIGWAHTFIWICHLRHTAQTASSSSSHTPTISATKEKKTRKKSSSYLVAPPSFIVLS